MYQGAETACDCYYVEITRLADNGDDKACQRAWLVIALATTVDRLQLRAENR